MAEDNIGKGKWQGDIWVLEEGRGMQCQPMYNGQEQPISNEMLVPTRKH